MLVSEAGAGLHLLPSTRAGGLAFSIRSTLRAGKPRFSPPSWSALRVQGGVLTGSERGCIRVDRPVRGGSAPAVVAWLDRRLRRAAVQELVGPGLLRTRCLPGLLLRVLVAFVSCHRSKTVDF